MRRESSIFRESIWWLIALSVTTWCAFCEDLKSMRRPKSKAKIKKGEDEKNRSRGIFIFRCSECWNYSSVFPNTRIENLLSIELEGKREHNLQCKCSVCVDNLELLSAFLQERLISLMKHDMRYVHYAVYFTYNIREIG